MFYKNYTHICLFRVCSGHFFGEHKDRVAVAAQTLGNAELDCSTSIVQFCFVFRHQQAVSCSQFHQHFTGGFCANIIVPKQFQSRTLTREKLYKTLLYNKVVLKMLMKVTPVLVPPR